MPKQLGLLPLDTKTTKRYSLFNPLFSLFFYSYSLLFQDAIPAPRLFNTLQILVHDADQILLRFFKFNIIIFFRYNTHIYTENMVNNIEMYIQIDINTK